MNAPATPLSRAEQQALSAPLLIEDEEIVRAIARLADERGTPMSEIVALAVQGLCPSPFLDIARAGMAPEVLDRPSAATAVRLGGR